MLPELGRLTDARPPRSVIARAGVITSLFMLVTAWSVPTLADVSYQDFSSTAGLTLVGGAAPSGSELHITSVSGASPGAVWYTAKQYVAGGFETLFQFRISDLQGAGGAGFAFVIQNSTVSAVGGSGAGLGYDGIANSVAVEFDTFQSPGQSDPDDNHISVHTRGTEPNSASETDSLDWVNPGPVDLDDGDLHTVKLVYLPGTMEIYINNLTDPVLEVAIDLASTLSLDNDRAWVGFTASMGSTDKQTHRIVNWTLTEQLSDGLLWRSSFETRASSAVSDSQSAVSIANAVGLPGTPLGGQPLTYSAYGQDEAPTAGAGSFALSFLDDRSLRIDTGLAGNVGDLSTALTIEGFFRIPSDIGTITSPSDLGRRLVTQRFTSNSTRLAIGLHATEGGSNRVGVSYRNTAGTTTTVLGISALAVDRWYYFALVYDGSTIKWYLTSSFPNLDPRLQGTVSNPDLASAGESTIIIGNHTSTRGFYGKLDEIRVTDRALSIAEFLCNGGACPSACEQTATTEPARPLWASGFETDAGDSTTSVSHGLAEGGTCSGIENPAGLDGTATGAVGLSYVAYGQGETGDALGAAAGDFALSFPSGRSTAINTHLPSNAGRLAHRITFEGLFNTADADPITDQTFVGRRLLTQKRSALANESRLAIGLHANAGQTANVLAVHWVEADQTSRMELGTTPIEPHTWYHFALVYDGANLRWYLNEHLEGTVIGVSLTAPGAAPVTVANLRTNGAADRGFYGILDEIHVYDRALEPAEFMLEFPFIKSWQSVHEHGNGVGDIALTLYSYGPVVVEPRRTSNMRIQITFDNAVQPVTGELDPEIHLSVKDAANNPKTVSTVAFVPGSDNKVIEVTVPALDDVACYTVSFPDSVLESADYHLPLSAGGRSDTDCQFCILVGDSVGILLDNDTGKPAGDGEVDLGDVGAIKTHNRQSVSMTTFRFDINGDGRINLIDAALAKSRVGVSTND